MQIRKCLKDIKPYIPGKLKEGAIKLASNENALGPSPKAMENIKNFANKINLYPDANCTKLKEKIAEKYNLTPEQVIIGNGSDEILLFIAGTFIEEGENVVTSESTFSEYTFATTLFGGNVKYAPMNEGQFQLDEIFKLVNAKTKAVFLCNPNNPTGAYFSQQELNTFLGKISKDVLVVVDEAYCEYVEASDYPQVLDLLSSYNNLLILRTFSKIYGLAGLRIGYGLGNKEIIYNMNKSREPFNVNSVAQIAAIGAIDDDDFLKKSRKNNAQGKAYLYQEFDNLGLKYFQTQANFIFVYIGKECMDAFQKLMDLGVTIRPMKGFGYEDAIRVTIGTKEQNEKFISCLKEYLGR